SGPPFGSEVYWQSVSSSSDGTSLVAVGYKQDRTGMYSGMIYTAIETPTTVTGSQGSSEQFQYIGSGVWQPVQANGTWSVIGGNLSYSAGNVGIGTTSPQ